METVVYDTSHTGPLTHTPYRQRMEDTGDQPICIHCHFTSVSTPHALSLTHMLNDTQKTKEVEFACMACTTQANMYVNN